MLDTVNAGISQTLYEISSVLLLPVLATVLVLLASTLLMLGGLAREGLDRRRTRAALQSAVNLVGSPRPDPLAVRAALEAAPAGLPRRYARLAGQRQAHAAPPERLLGQLETEVAVTLGRLGFLTRVGPMLGLLGTLIPFGPALAGLSSNDVRALSANLVTAFATTVVGLLCGSLAFGMGCVRRGWYSRDFDDLEYVVQRLSEGNRHEAAHDQKVGGDGRRSDGRIGQLV